jgi:hypothetical protein
MVFVDGRAMLSFHQPTFDLAKERGCFEREAVQACSAKIPPWLRHLETDEGIAAFEQQHQMTFPASVREFYQNTVLVCLARASGLDFFQTQPEVCVIDPPPMLILYHDYYGDIPFAVPLDGRDDPPLCGDFTPNYGQPGPAWQPLAPDQSFSKHLYELVYWNWPARLTSRPHPSRPSEVDLSKCPPLSARVKDMARDPKRKIDAFRAYIVETGAWVEEALAAIEAFVAGEAKGSA